MLKRKEREESKSGRNRQLLTSGALLAYEALKKSPELRRKLTRVGRRKGGTAGDQPDIKCPHCGSTALHLVRLGARQCNVKRALGGALILGWPGLVLGLTGARPARS